MNIPDTRPFYAHSENGMGNWETVEQHRERVTVLAEAFAAAWGSAWEGRVAGLFHDLGKYGDLFQGVLLGTEQKVNHSTPGAYAVLKRYGVNGLAAALAIQGHHGGLKSAYPRNLSASLSMQEPVGHDGRRYSSRDVAKLVAQFEADGGCWPAAGACRMAAHQQDGLVDAAMLDGRMLFSALVDADYLATEAHFGEGPDGYRTRPPGPALLPHKALDLVLAEVQRLKSCSQASAEMLALRSDLMQACLAAGQWPQGIFNLTAPTGTGKTLAMMAFALRHAREYGLRRVIVVLPYLSIIDQSAEVYERVFDSMPAGYVLQDHSLACDPQKDEEGNGRLAAQNWDAPIIITTTVRFFESLFANRPTDCRKLHNVASSVIVFDETQTMPVGLAVPTLAALSHLQAAYRCSVVFSTATQPAFEPIYTQIETKARRSVQGWHPREIAGPELKLFERARRVTFSWPSEPVPWETLAACIAQQRQALVIVNLRRHAGKLFCQVRAIAAEGTYHLSTNMCPAHRLEVLNEVRRRLAEGLPCRLVSTQCVEAGVDLDFPEVWRALGPLDAIAQAAGRCNREGRQATGRVHVFLPPAEKRLYPSDDYQEAATTLRQMLVEDEQLDLGDPDIVHEYYLRYYEINKLAENKALATAIPTLDFEEVAKAYRWIDGDGASVLVPFDPLRELYGKLARQARDGEIDATWIREARPLAVGVRGRMQRSLLDIAEEVRNKKGDPAGWYILLEEAQAYDPMTGLDLGEAIADEKYLV